MLKTRTITTIDCHDIGDAYGALVGKPCSGLDACVQAFEEIADGSMHSVTVPWSDDEYRWEPEVEAALLTVDAFLAWEPDSEKPWAHAPAPDIRVMLDRLHEAGQIEAGQYTIECGW